MELYGKYLVFGLNGFDIKNIILNAGNSGTLARLIGLLINNQIKLVGDKSLSRRDFTRVTEPLKCLVQILNQKIMVTY